MDWKQFKKKFEERTGKDSKILDYIAVVDYLYFCAEGLGNEDIASILETPAETVENIIYEFLGFRGFEKCLTFSPLKEYDPDKITPFNTNVKIYLEIKEQVEKYYEEQ